MFQLSSEYSPRGDQPQAIATLTDLVREGRRHMVLRGVTGSGKTYSIANVVANVDRPTLVISPNKTLAAQLFSEFRAFWRMIIFICAQKNRITATVEAGEIVQREFYFSAG